MVTKVIHFFASKSLNVQTISIKDAKTHARNSYSPCTAISREKEGIQFVQIFIKGEE